MHAVGVRPVLYTEQTSLPCATSSALHNAPCSVQHVSCPLRCTMLLFCVCMCYVHTVGLRPVHYTAQSSSPPLCTMLPVMCMMFLVPCALQCSLYSLLYNAPCRLHCTMLLFCAQFSLFLPLHYTILPVPCTAYGCLYVEHSLTSTCMHNLHAQC